MKAGVRSENSEFRSQKPGAKSQGPGGNGQVAGIETRPSSSRAPARGLLLAPGSRLLNRAAISQG